MATESKETVTIIGGGLVGSLMAIFLARRGFCVDVYERRPDMRATQINAGRSINMAMSLRGIYALGQVGVVDEVMDLAIPMRGRMIHPSQGDLKLHPYGKNETEVIHSVSRGELNKTLITEAERYDGVRFFFHERCVNMEMPSGEVFMQNAQGETWSLTPDRIIAADGSGSAVRTALQDAGRFNFSQEYLDHGYKELTIPPGPDGTFLMEPNALHIWPRGLYMLIALPNPDGSFTCTLFFPFEGDDSFDGLSDSNQVRSFFQRQFPDAAAMIPDLADLYFANPTGALMTVKCFPWHYQNRALLMGDAAHAIVPFFGQGMNCGFEDCTVLDECIGQYWPDWERVFESFGFRRKDNADAIADMALGNYIEMRDRVSDAAFVLESQLGLALEMRFPNYFIPKYSLVSFHRGSYAEALRRGKIQEEILQTLCSSLTSVDEVDWETAEQLVKERLGKYQEG